MANMTSFQTPQMVQNKLGSMQGDLKSTLKHFSAEMDYNLLTYSNSESDLAINGITVKAKDKYGIFGTLLYSKFMTDTTKAIETVMGFKTSLFSLEKSLTSKMGG